MSESVLSPASLEAVSFDFTGTLARPHRIGTLYSEALARHGISIPPGTLERLFPEVWRELDCRVHLGEDRFRSHPEGPEGFWGELLERILLRAGVDEEPSAFLVRELFDRFRQADAWRVFPDVSPALETLRDLGLRLAVLSNFDPRLEEILRALDLRRFFAEVVTSYEVGAEKPHPGPFRELQSRIGLPGRRILHVGNERRRDVEGARAAGWRALWLRRDDPGADLRSLRTLPEAIREPGRFW
ncbi:MAG: HAD-IA family hydrolase [Thermoanaerobaculia bacterium]|nr:HAD-IA family hydrolase [Thermoanaerobaculia bacterium]